MNYTETLDYLYAQLPMFQKVGNQALKKGLSNILLLCEKLGNPYQKFKSVHVAGTNGKGSSSHVLASILQSAGYKTGLYTSPHLKNFTERIRIDGEEISKEAVVEFVQKIKSSIEEIQPSFFEITVAMAFDYFAQAQVDIAIIEVGLGGRLDSTNIIQPEICLITNIGYDHTEWLGETLPEIASEKAGIIKENTPVVISEKQAEVQSIFEQVAQKHQAPIFFASDSIEIIPNSNGSHHQLILNNKEKVIEFEPELQGKHQLKNLTGVYKVVKVLNRSLGFSISKKDLKKGIENVTQLTNLKGRWQTLQEKPKVVCDVGHNEDGVKQILAQIEKFNYKQLWIIWGMVKEKKVDKILAMLPKKANYIFCQANLPRALAAEELQEKAQQNELRGIITKDVNQALNEVLEKADKEDLIFVGGSTFIVAELDGL